MVAKAKAPPRARVAAAPKKKPSLTDVKIPALQLRTVKIRIKGKTPLIQHRFSDKGKKQMADAQAQKVRGKRPPKDPRAEFEAAIDYVPGTKKPGIKAGAFKQAAVSACRYVEGISMATAKGAFHVVGDFTWRSRAPSPRCEPTRSASVRSAARWPTSGTDRCTWGGRSR